MGGSLRAEFGGEEMAALSVKYSLCWEDSGLTVFSKASEE